jgi:hypothetical protein
MPPMQQQGLSTEQTAIQSLSRSGGERGTYEWRCYVRLKCEKAEKSVVIMAMDVRLFWQEVTTAMCTGHILRVSARVACH